ncbi:MAG TPA: TRAP transporter large permease subunit [Aliidongia sp.]|nr:TRAP transporter large permease subunit [Aliidongia sp.]
MAMVTRSPPRPLWQLDLALAWLTEVPAAILVVLEVAVLFAGVVARYVFNRPLVWSDELATFLFLWLAMLGSVVALRRGEHMRLTVIANRVPAAWRGALDTFTAIIVAVFVLEIILPARRYFMDQAAVTSPALDIPDSWRTSAIAVGAVLMMVVALFRLAQRSTPWQILGGLAATALIAGGLFWAKPFFMTLGNYNLVIFFVGIVSVCVLLGVPIAFAFGVSTMSYLAVTTRMPLLIVVNRMDGGMSSLILLAIPLFIFLGLLMDWTGLARVLVDFMASLLGHVRGGLAYVLLGAMYLVSGISGSKAADMAAVAPVLFPEMQRRGAKGAELVALLGASGAMSETIPPSLVLITIGSVTGVSISALFIGGLLPAAVAALALVLLAWWRYRGEDLSGVRRAPLREVGRTFLLAIPALILPFIIRAAVVDGIATATEVSTVGVVYTLLVGALVYGKRDWSKLYPLLVETAALSGAILLIIGTATAMAWALTQSGFSRQLVTAMAGMPGGKVGFLAVSILAFIVLGSVLEGIPAMVLFGPLLFPVARALGVHEVHYAMVVILAMGIGLFAPPFGVGYYAACAIGRVSPDEAMGQVWIYLGAVLAALLLVAAVPWLSIGFL